MRKNPKTSSVPPSLTRPRASQRYSTADNGRAAIATLVNLTTLAKRSPEEVDEVATEVELALRALGGTFDVSLAELQRFAIERIGMLEEAIRARHAHRESTTVLVQELATAMDLHLVWEAFGAMPSHSQTIDAILADVEQTWRPMWSVGTTEVFVGPTAREHAVVGDPRALAPLFGILISRMEAGSIGIGCNLDGEIRIAHGNYKGAIVHRTRSIPPMIAIVRHVIASMSGVLEIDSDALVLRFRS